MRDSTTASRDQITFLSRTNMNDHRNIDSDEVWQELDRKCKEVTGFSARDIALPLLAAELDPRSEACKQPEISDIVADLLGSSGDTNSRNAANALIAALEDQQYALTYQAQRRWFRVVAHQNSSEEVWMICHALRMLRGVFTSAIILDDADDADDEMIVILGVDGPSQALLQAIVAIKGVQSVTLRNAEGDATAT